MGALCSSRNPDAGIAQSRVNVTRSKACTVCLPRPPIQNFVLASAKEPPFRQPQVTASFDVLVDPNQKTIDIQRLLVESPQIKIQKGQFTRTRRDNTVQAQGVLDAQVDWTAIAPLASRFIPGQLSLTGQKPIAVNFTSTYPANQPNGLLAHLNSQASLGFDRAAYLGFDFGPVQLVVRSQDGLMTIGPVSTTVNNGKLEFRRPGQPPAIPGAADDAHAGPPGPRHPDQRADSPDPAEVRQPDLRRRRRRQRER
jgi:hypothetical protein